METEIIETQDGSHSLFSNRFGVSYHSRYGAVRESRHVFIEAGLFYKAITQKKIAVLEIGMGSGLNAFLTVLEAERLGLHIDYVAVEAFPVSPQQASQLNYPALLGATDRRDTFLQIHQGPWEEEQWLGPQVRFKKVLRRFEEIEYRDAFDLIFFDAFAPEAQPELWDITVLSRMYAALRDQGILVTYCAKGIVKRRLRSLGFLVEALPGPPGKREMTRCRKEEKPEG